jgi:hypothetical protein
LKSSRKKSPRETEEKRKPEASAKPAQVAPAQPKEAPTPVAASAKPKEAPKPVAPKELPKADAQPSDRLPQKEKRQAAKPGLSFHDLPRADQAALLAAPPKPCAMNILGEKVRYHISMENHYLSPKGELAKKQELNAEYARVAVSALTRSSMSLEFTWDWVDFASGSWKGDAVRSDWTFAKGLKFFHYRTLPEPALPERGAYGDNEGPAGIVIDYSGLLATPSVNLLYMLSWDVTAFEEMLSRVLERLDRFAEAGAPVEIDSMSDTYAQLDFRDVSAKDSFFRNGTFMMTFLGMGAWKGSVGMLFEYKCVGELAVRSAKAEASAVSQVGSSYYFGKLLLDARTGDLLRGSMTELLSGVITNKEGKWVPQQKRRLVAVDRIGAEK